MMFAWTDIVKTGRQIIYDFHLEGMYTAKN